MRIINAFPYFNESHLLPFRYSYLEDVVDIFIIAEGSHTHAGIPKPFSLLDTQFKCETVYCPVVFPSHLLKEEVSAWKREGFQRSYLQFVVKSLSLDDEDLVIFQDADEFPDRDILLKYKSGEVLPADYPERQLQDMYYYNLTCKAYTPHSTTTLTKVKHLRSTFEIDYAVKNPLPQSKYKNGWHFSYFLSVDQIQTKIKSFAHQEYNTSYFLDKDRILNRISNGKDLYDRPNNSTHAFHHLPISENDYLPPEVKEYFL